ncbi:MAG TPA: ABC transporter ATP-binding protein [Syntrophomonadaceae bacterium]|nr:ABC transporter ATP-binding protein [Syntrophomonadaceae bacterium]
MIRLENLCKQYITGTIQVAALQGVSFQVVEGEFVAIMGASGSGKSTLMNLLGLLDSPDQGSYCLDGIQTADLGESERARVRNEKIGFVFQAFNLLPRLTALENVELPMVYAGVRAVERHKRAWDALERLGLEERARHRPNELSGGQNQRVAIARALVNKPALLLADEPTGALDTRTSEEIIEVFQELNNQGATIVLVTHEPEIAGCTRRILRISDGCLVADEPVPNPRKASSSQPELERQAVNQ